jgi:hypothetical protein
MSKQEIDNYEIKLKEFGKPIFKAKGRKDKVKKETAEFFKLKF